MEPQSRQQRAAHNLRGMLWAFGAAVSVMVMSSLMKQATLELPVMEVVCIRMIMLVALWLPWAMRNGGAGFRVTRPWLMVFRALAGLGSITMLTYALSYLKLADATVLAFSVPLWMIPISFLLLREVADWQRVAATVVGFIGVVMIVRPGFDTHPAMFSAIGSAVLTCFTMLSVKQLMLTHKAGTTIFYYALIAMIVSGIPAFFVWVMPSWTALGILALASVAASMGQYCLARAYGIGDATVVAPMNFSRLPIALAIGLIVFGEWPDNWSIAGMTVILAATMVISVREARLRHGGK